MLILFLFTLIIKFYHKLLPKDLLIQGSQKMIE